MALAGVKLAAAREAFDYDQCRADAGEDATSQRSIPTRCSTRLGARGRARRRAAGRPRSRRELVGRRRVAVAVPRAAGRRGVRAVPERGPRVRWPGRLAFAPRRPRQTRPRGARTRPREERGERVVSRAQLRAARRGRTTLSRSTAARRARRRRRRARVRATCAAATRTGRTATRARCARAALLADRARGGARRRSSCCSTSRPPPTSGRRRRRARGARAADAGGARAAGGRGRRAHGGDGAHAALARHYDPPLLSLPFLVNASRGGAGLGARPQIPCFVAALVARPPRRSTRPRRTRACVRTRSRASSSRACPPRRGPRRRRRPRRRGGRRGARAAPPPFFLGACRTSGRDVGAAPRDPSRGARRGDDYAPLRHRARPRRRRRARRRRFAPRCAADDEGLSADDDAPGALALPGARGRRRVEGSAEKRASAKGAASRRARRRGPRRGRGELRRAPPAGLDHVRPRRGAPPPRSSPVRPRAHAVVRHVRGTRARRAARSRSTTRRRRRAAQRDGRRVLPAPAAPPSSRRRCSCSSARRWSWRIRVTLHPVARARAAARGEARREEQHARQPDQRRCACSVCASCKHTTTPGSARWIPAPLRKPAMRVLASSTTTEVVRCWRASRQASARQRTPPTHTSTGSAARAHQLSKASASASACESASASASTVRSVVPPVSI